MPFIVDRPSDSGSINALAKRVEDIERRISRVGRPQPEPIYVPFSRPGAVAVSESGKTITGGGTLSRVTATLKTAGSSSTVVTVYRNGVSIGTVTLASSATSAEGSFAHNFVPDADLMSVGVTTAGTGAADLVVIAKLG